MKDIRYVVNPKHRNMPPKEDRTQWIVSAWHEIKLFGEGQLNGWVHENNTVWAIEYNGEKHTTLGETDRRVAYMAKYVVDHNNEWHGYPVSPSNADRPPSSILDDWENKGLISAPKKRKIVQGKW
ncbi:hypothetical protein VCSRO70_3586 [Vibrio cholerae]|nr:hypothetical protein VCSRO70_3586 [Vibrio cholerae]